MKKTTKSEIVKLLARLSKAANALSYSCSDNYGTEAADNGEYENYWGREEKKALDKVLLEIKQKGLDSEKV